MALQPAVVGLARVGNTRVGYLTSTLATYRAVRYSLTVNGTDRTHYIDRYSIDVNDDINELPNTCAFECFGFTPAVDQVVKMLYGDPLAKEFEGTIVSVTEAHDRLSGRIVFRVACTDYTRLLDARLVTKAYGSQSATNTARDIITNFSTGFTQVNIANDLPTVTAIQFKMTPVSSALRQLCDAFGGDCFVDYDKDVHLFLTDTAITPDAITTSNTAFKNFRYTSDISRLANRIQVEGLGTPVLFDVPITILTIPFANIDLFSTGFSSLVINDDVIFYAGRSTTHGNATNTTAVASVGASQLQVGDVNNLETTGWVFVANQYVYHSGTSGTTLLNGIPTSGVGSIASTIPSGSQVVQVPQVLAGALTNAISAGADAHLLEQRDDATSQSTYGIRYAYIQDRRLSVAGAQARGDAELALRKNPFVSGSFVTTDTKVRSGRRVTVTMAAWGISGTYTITKVRLFFKEGDQHLQREVTFASNAGDSDLYRILRRLRENQQQLTGA